MKVAIVHEWLTTYAGAENVLALLLSMYPDADLFCVVDFLPEKDRSFLKGRSISTTFIQKLPFARKKYRSYLPLMPMAIEQLDVSAYDLVISSSHAVAKGVITGPDQHHICYIYSPIRYAWDLQHQYLREAGLDKGLKGLFARMVLHYMRIWDVRTAHGVDHFISISEYIKKRVYKVYRRKSEVVYPPVDTEYFALQEEKESFYLSASRMVPYKMMPLVAEAFAGMPDKELIIIGDGPELPKVKSVAEKAPNIKVLGYLPREQLRDYMQRARAFVFAAEEDFGIAPLEAQACGTPVICFGKGGTLETIRPDVTGIYFEKQALESIRKAVDRFETMDFNAIILRQNAERFSKGAFVENFRELIDKLVS
jgi:glycosyltransferase involved in cell wall biosynthesis